MVLARYTLMAQGCEFLAIPTQDLGPIWDQHIGALAREGRWYVLNQGQVMAPYGESMQHSDIARVYSDDHGSQWYPTMLNYFKDVYQCEEKKGGLRLPTSGNATLRSEPVAADGGKCAKFFMDGGLSVADPYGRFLVEPVHSNDPESVQKAKDGCKHSLEAGMPEKSHCKFVQVDGYNGDEEFLVLTYATRGEVLESKTYQDNVGNYARTDIWQVTWNNAPRNILFETKDGDAQPGHDLMPQQANP